MKRCPNKGIWQLRGFEWTPLVPNPFLTVRVFLCYCYAPFCGRGAWKMFLVLGNGLVLTNPAVSILSIWIHASMQSGALKGCPQSGNSISPGARCRRGASVWLGGAPVRCLCWGMRCDSTVRPALYSPQPQTLFWGGQLPIRSRKCQSCP